MQRGSRLHVTGLGPLMTVLLATGGPSSGTPLPAYPETEPGRLPVAVTDIPGVERGVFRDGRVFLAGQPNSDALRRFRDLRVRVVVNLRTPEEMANPSLVPFDLPARVAELGMEFVEIPINGRDYPYTPEAVDRLADVMTRRPDPILLFCNGAVRVSYLWAAYLVRYRGFDLDTALAHGRAAGIPPDPMAGLLGRRLRLIQDDP